MPGLDQYNNFRMRNNLPLDNKYLNGNIPYTSVAEACNLLPASERNVGLTVMINADEFWWKEGTSDGQLIFKSSGGGGSSNFSGNYNDLTNKPALVPVATSGDYNDLTNKPALHAVATSGSYPDLVNKPLLATVATSGAYNDLSGKPTLGLVATSNNYYDLSNLPDVSGAGGYTAGAGISISPEKIITNTGGTGSNPEQIINIDDPTYGGAADCPGTSFTGTNNSTALAAAITAAPNGGVIVVPPGKRYFATQVTIPQTKRLTIRIWGDCYAPNGVYFVGIGQQHHDIRIFGDVICFIGLTGHSKADYDAGTGMNASTGTRWASLTASAIKFNDCLRGFYYVSKVNGAKAAIHFVGGTTGNEGGQELTIQFSYLQVNNYGIWLESGDGTSYIDKFTFSGPNGGTGKIGGNQAVFIDGGVAETGAARSNNFNNILFEFCNRGLKITGDATYNKFMGCRWEGGVNTGCFSQEYININNTAVAGGKVPLGQQLIGCSHIYLQWLTNIGEQFAIYGTPIWTKNSEFMIASMAVGHSPGRLTVFGFDPISVGVTLANLPANIDYIGIGTALADPVANFAITKINGVVKTLPYSGGGSSQWTDVTGGITYANKVRAGSAAAPTAKMHVAGTTTPATANTGGLKIDAATLMNNPENGLFENDGTDPYFTTLSLRKKLMVRPPGGGAYQMLRVNAAGNADEYVNAPYSLEYSQVGPTTPISGNSTLTILKDGQQSIKPFSPGDILEVKGSGSISVASFGSNSLTLVFVIAGRSKTLTRIMTNSATNHRFEYYIRLVPYSSTAATIYYNVIVGDDDTRFPFSENVTSGINIATPTFNATAQWSVIGTTNVISPFQNIIELKRK